MPRMPLLFKSGGRFDSYVPATYTALTMPRGLYSLVALTLIALVLGACQSAATAAPAESYGFSVYPIEKIRPFQLPKPAATSGLRAAGNSYEAILFGLANPGAVEQSIVSVSVNLGDQRLTAELFGVQYYNATPQSRWFDPDTVGGLWPDPLIPVGQSFSGQLDFSFPGGIAVPAGQNRHFLLELRLPPAFRGASLVQASLVLADGRRLQFQFKLEAYNFDLPSQPGIVTSVNLDRNAMATQHGVDPKSPEAQALFLAYRRQMALHNLAPYYASDKPVAVSHDDQGQPQFDYTDFDAEAGPFLEGQLFPDAPKPGSFWVPEFSIPDAQPGDEAAAYRDLQEHLRAKGWLGRSIRFLRDEPLIQQFVSIRASGEAMRKAAPDIPTMVTAPYNDRLAPVVDLFCPDILGLGDSLPGYPLFFRNGNPVVQSQLDAHPRKYRSLAKNGQINWLYSCNSAQLLDIPNVFIDSAAAYQRSIAWLMFRYGFSGFLYWHANAAYSIGGKPWDSQFSIHTHGDGTLFYPGHRGQFWLESEQPVPSIRLKLLRQGFQDYEYLKLYQAKFGAQAAYDQSGRATRTSLEWQRSATALNQLRDNLARQIQDS